MTTFYHYVDSLAFQHQVLGAAKEMKFRLTELIDASRRDFDLFRQSIEHKKPIDEAGMHVLPYRFSSVLALLQTFRDSLIGALGKKFDIRSLDAQVPHADLFRKLRNAFVHDGYQPVGLWADGRYYLPANIQRTDTQGKPVLIEAPADDVETLCLQYAREYCVRLATLLEALPPTQKLRGPQLSYEWFQAAWLHPAAQKAKGSTELPSRQNFSQLPANQHAPLDAAASLLREIGSQCEARLSETKSLPIFPFP